MDKKLKCPNCGVKSVIIEPNEPIGRCHLCGKEVSEQITKVIGNFEIIQRVTPRNFRFLEFTVDLKKYEVEENGDTATIKIYEEG